MNRSGKEAGPVVSEEVGGPTLVIEGERNSWKLGLAEVWAYRELLTVMIGRDLSVRYRQAVLGIAWAVIQPALSVAIFTVLFTRIARIPVGDAPYPVFVLCGLLPWTFFSTGLASSSMSLVGAGSVITKVYFPRIIVPISSIGVALADFIVASLLLGVLMAYYGIAPAATALLAPLPILALGLLVAGLGAAAAAVMVRFRDVKAILPFVVQVGLFATPVVYPLSAIPERWRWVAALNPVAGLVEFFRASVLGLPVDYRALAISGTVALVVALAGFAYFHRVERQFADVI